MVVLVGILTVVNSTIGSSLPSGAINFIAEYWSITSLQQLVLPTSIFSYGYVVGPLAFGPLSETYGRRPVMLYTSLVYCGFTLGCALAPYWPLFLVFHRICGGMASAPITVLGGLYDEIYHDPRTRGGAMAYFMAATTFGPVMRPYVFGFLSTISWKWKFWFGLILAGITLPFLIALPDTYLPVLLHQEATKIGEETGNQELVALCELEKQGPR